MRTDSIKIQDETAIIATPKGEMLMDVADIWLLDGVYLSLRSVKAGGPPYARIESYSKPRIRRTLHRVIMQAPDGMVVDHINHNTLDNRRANLRVCTISENSRNGRKQRQSKSKYKGVVYHAFGRHDGSRSGGVPRRWRAYTRVMGKRIWLGYHATEEDAAKAYNDFASKTFGEFACLNQLMAG